MARLFIINGAPGVGKTTLLRWLSAQLGMPALSKDDIKEFMFDAVGYSDRDWSRILGRASAEMLYVFARECLAEGQSLIIENAFWPEYATPVLRQLVDDYHADITELYCHTDEETRMERFRGRHDMGERHPGHVDNLATLRDVANYQPLGIGQLIRIDTSGLPERTFEQALSELPTLFSSNS